MTTEVKAKAGKVPAQQLCEQLGIKRNPLFLKAKALGLSLAMEWTQKRSAELAALAGTMTPAALAEHFHVTLSSLAEEAKRQGLSLGKPAPVRTARKRAPAPVPVSEVSPEVDAIPSMFSNGAWIEQADAAEKLVPEVQATQTPVLEGVSYSITTPDRSPPSPALIEALQPVVEAAVQAMRAQSEAPTAEPAAALPAVEIDRLERLRDEEAGRAIAASEPLPVANRRQRLAARNVPKLAGRSDPPSKWVRLQHPDGRWLRMDGLELTDKKAASFLVQRSKLENVTRAFPLARECRVVSEPAWTPRDIAYAGAVR